MNKSEYIELFDKFAKTSIKIGTDCPYLYGHNVDVTLIDSTWDVIIQNNKEYTKGNLTAYLGTGKLNNIYATLPENIRIHKLDGEGWFQTTDIGWLKSWLLDNRKALGIAKRVERDKSTYTGLMT
jgi:hypothetical protein